MPLQDRVESLFLVGRVDMCDSELVLPRTPYTCQIPWRRDVLGCLSQDASVVSSAWDLQPLGR
jgi:hypothetical protein